MATTLKSICADYGITNRVLYRIMEKAGIPAGKPYTADKLAAIEIPGLNAVY
ncbi:MAG: hypothetical protein LBS17_03115 [Actinomycetes bacterium]|jgi:hypothetical protein|nr:hypothetical protein [Actinomycetes bacterium]